MGGGRQVQKVVEEVVNLRCLSEDEEVLPDFVSSLR